MSASVVITTLNEANSIVALLDSLASQTLKPSEIVVVDAGSTDQTLSLIKSWQAAHPAPTIRTLVAKGANRSLARNLGIRKAKSTIIAVTDAGCRADRHWLERLVRPIENLKADSVAGFYQPTGETPFQQAVAPFVAVMPNQFNPDTYLPSSRSVAFTKDAWRVAGGYPGHLNYCEDLVFARALKSQTRLAVAPGAIVHWRQVSTLPQFFRQIATYARGDWEADYTPHLLKIISVFLRYTIFIFVKPLFLLYLFWPILKHSRQSRDPQVLIWAPALQLTADAAIIFATITFFLPFPRITPQPQSV